MVILQITAEQLSSLIQGAVYEAIGAATSNTPPYNDELLTVQEAAEFLNLAVATIYAMTQRKEIPHAKRAGRLYFSKSELIDYVKAGRQKTVADIEAQATAYVGSKNKRRIHA